MKLAYLTSKSNSVEPFIFREIQDTLQLGVKVEVFSLVRGKNVKTFNPSSITRTIPALSLLAPFYFCIGLVVSNISIFRPILVAFSTRSFIDLFLALTVLTRFLSGNYNAIHAHFGDHKLFVAYYLHLLSGVPVVTTLHAHEFYTNPNPKLFKYIVTKLPLIVVIAKKWKDLLVSDFNVLPSRIVVNKLPPSSIYSNLALKPFNILTVARLTPRKGHKLIFTALKILNDPSIRLVVVGSGDHNILNLINEYRLQDQVIHFDSLSPEQLCYFYDTSDLLCLPSLHTTEEGPEGIPVVLIEGAYRKIPILATNCGATSELIPSKFLVNPSPELLADAIVKFRINSHCNTNTIYEIAKKEHGRNNTEHLLHHISSIIRL